MVRSMSATTTRIQIRVARVSVRTGRTIKVISTDPTTVDEAERFIAGYGRHSGCTQEPWGDWRTVNRVQFGENGRWT